MDRIDGFSCTCAVKADVRYTGHLCETAGNMITDLSDV